jgi:hypothetical protein
LGLRGIENWSLDNLGLRQQLMALQRTDARPRLQARDRLFWIASGRIWANWRTAVVLVRPKTVLREASRVAPPAVDPTSTPRANGRAPVAPEIRVLVRERARESVMGSARIHGELRTLGLEVSERTAPRLLTRVTRPASETWRTFVQNPLASAVQMDFFAV